MTKSCICKEFLKVSYDHFSGKKITDSHSIEWHNVKSSEWGISKREIEGKTYLVVAICGSNDFADWVLNFFPYSVRGYKFSGWWEAKRVFKSIKKLKIFNVPLIVATHSKSGCTGWPLYEKCKKAGMVIDSIHAFAPAKGLRKKMSIPEAILYIDKDDPVPKAGLTLNHPIPGSIFDHPEKDAPHLGTEDHPLSHWDNVIT